VVKRPVISAGIAAAIAFAVQSQYEQAFSPLLRLTLSCALLFSVYAVMLLFVMRQKAFYVDLVRTLGNRAPLEEKAPA